MCTKTMISFVLGFVIKHARYVNQTIADDTILGTKRNSLQDWRNEVIFIVWTLKRLIILSYHWKCQTFSRFIAVDW